jgi:hypothetical protein
VVGEVLSVDLTDGSIGFTVNGDDIHVDSQWSSGNIVITAMRWWWVLTAIDNGVVHEINKCSFRSSDPTPPRFCPHLPCTVHDHRRVGRQGKLPNLLLKLPSTQRV